MALFIYVCSCFLFPWTPFIPIRLLCSLFLSSLIVLFFCLSKLLPWFFLNLFFSFVVSHLYFWCFASSLCSFHKTSLKFSVSAFSSSSFPFTIFIFSYVFPVSPSSFRSSFSFFLFLPFVLCNLNPWKALPWVFYHLLLFFAVIVKNLCIVVLLSLYHTFFVNHNTAWTL